jgi:RNA polymerase sigma-70 factor (ECF subfamily)
MTPTAIPVDTATIVDAAIAGDRDAFGDLYRQYVDQVFRYCYFRVATKQLAEDLCADTFVRALRYLDTYEHRGRDFGAWLYTIARNLIYDNNKSSRHRREVSTGEMLDLDETEPGADIAVLADMGTAAVHAAVQRLNDLQRECVTLRFLQGLTVAETAAAMDMKDGAVKTLQYRAVRTLARNTTLMKAVNA